MAKRKKSPKTQALDDALRQKYQEIDKDVQAFEAFEQMHKPYIARHEIPSAIDQEQAEIATPAERRARMLAAEEANRPKPPVVLPEESSQPEGSDEPEEASEPETLSDEEAVQTGEAEVSEAPVQNPTKSRAHMEDWLRCAVIGSILLGGSLFMLVGTRPTISMEENRKLAEKPSFSWAALTDGSYTADWMTYYADTVPGRSTFKRWIGVLENRIGVQSDDDTQFFGTIHAIEDSQSSEPEPIENSAVEQPETATPLTTDAPAQTAPPDAPELHATEITDIGDGIVLIEKRAMSVFGGSFENGAEYARQMELYAQELGDGVQVWSLITPTAISYYLPESYAGYSASETDNIRNVYDHFERVHAVDVYDVLRSHIDEDIFARTDHHWLPLGAFYAAQTFEELAGVPVSGFDDYTAISKEGYLGSMYTFTQSDVLRRNPETFTYYVPKNSYTTTYSTTDLSETWDGNLLLSLDNLDPVSWYLVFMGTDETVTHVHTDVANGRKVVMVKDSFGNAIVPCLTQSFEDIYVVDMRYFTPNLVSYIREVGATDLLFVTSAFGATGSGHSYIEQLRTQ